MKKIGVLVLFIFCMSGVYIKAQQKPWIDFNSNGKMDVYENPDATIDNRVADLLSQMTVYEKMQLLHETAPAIPRLGIKKYYHGNEALHGIIRPGKFTVFPQAIALAATWNPDLIYNVSTAISDEARARWNELGEGELQKSKYTDLLTFWSPTVNMARDPRWGRTPETYGEDPYLTSCIGVAFVKGLQGNDPRYLKVVSTPKHFVGNNEEHNRFSCNAKMSERALRSYYLPAFKALITKGKAQSIMTAYNAINDVPCTANKFLLTDLLRNEWGFNGYVVSDCGAPGFLYSDHKYVQTREDAAALSLKAGLDLECSGYCKECFIFRDYLSRVYEMGKVTESEINNAAFRVLRARFKLGFFDDSSLNPYSKISAENVGCSQHQQLALDAARQSIVLLKNEKNILPLNVKKIKKIAVLGINANSCEFGDYSGIPVNKPVSPYMGIKNKVGNKIKVETLMWLGKLSNFEPIPSNFLEPNSDKKTGNGLKAEYFENEDFNGVPHVKMDEQLLYDPINQPPDPSISDTPMSIRWSGYIVPKVTGKYILAVKGQGRISLHIDGKQVINWIRNATDTISIQMIKGKKYEIKVEYKNCEKQTFASLLWKTPKTDTDVFAKEKKLAKQSDVVIAVMGINRSIEREGLDRKSLELPKDQIDFIKEIYKANPKTIVVLVAGSSMAINWTQNNIPAIVNAWYPGEQGGNAIADVLFGDYNPAGRLPLTYYKSIDDLPAFDDYEVFNNRTYMYFNNETLYPFGYGLSYTDFQYGNLMLNKTEINSTDTIKINMDIKNIGNYDGDEVVQLYIRHEREKEIMPIKQLKAFKRIHLKKGEKQTLTFELAREYLSFWNNNNEFVTTPGKYEIMVGASSSDIRKKTDFSIVKQDKK